MKAEIRARRVTGGAVVTVIRGARVRRYRVGLCRYAWLREWTVSGRCGERSGYWGRGGIEVYLWAAA